jgi:hypothetical protein
MRQHGAWIGRNEDAESSGERFWFGQHVFHRSELARLSQLRRMMIGTAGAAAEDAWRSRLWESHGSPEPPDPAYDFADWCDALSPSDWDLAGGSYEEWPAKTARAAVRVSALLRGPLWAPLLAAGRTLIREGLILPPRMPDWQRSAMTIQLRLERIRERAAGGELREVAP